MVLPRRRRRWRWLLPAAALLAVSLGWLACAPLQRAVDRQGLADNAALLMADESLSPPSTLVAVLAAPTGDGPARAPDVMVTTRDRWVMATVDGRQIINEIGRFQSFIRSGAREANVGAVDIYRHGALGERPVILWVPGRGFAAIGLPFFQAMYERILARGYDLVVWIPPYHLMRQQDGADAGDGFLRVDVADNVQVFQRMTHELEAIVAWLHGQGVTTVGGWGGSVGGALLWQASATVPFDHLALMIPILDWRSFARDPPEMQSVQQRLHDAGYSDALLDEAYRRTSPAGVTSLVDPGRILLQYARSDQLTSEALSLDFARRHGILRVIGYERSHASMLLTPSLYSDYAAFLDDVMAKSPAR
jgi:acetyl esterase/lipase